MYLASVKHFFMFRLSNGVHIKYFSQQKDIWVVLYRGKNQPKPVFPQERG